MKRAVRAQVVWLRSWGLACLMAAGVGGASAGESAGLACFKPQAPPDAQWDVACVRQAYAGAPESWPRPDIDPGVVWQELAPVPQQAPFPPDNPPSAEKETLGRKLFFDARFSRKGEVSCAACHQPARSFTDGRQLAVGDERLQGRRRTQTLFGAPFAPSQFWDGRAATLEQQVLMPIANPFEMNHALQDMVRKLAALPDYPPLFKAAFGRSEPRVQDVAQALATFVRSIRPPSTRFDEFLQGKSQALSDEEMLGLHVFRTKARCMNCHSGPLMSDFQFHDLGLSFYGRRNQDLGRFEFTRDKAHLGQFKTPSLRGVALAGPYMHNGIFPSLIAVVRMYNGGMGQVNGKADDPYVPRKSPMIHKLGLTAVEMEALAAWMQAL